MVLLLSPTQDGRFLPLLNFTKINFKSFTARLFHNILNQELVIFITVFVVSLVIIITNIFTIIPVNANVDQNLNALTRKNAFLI